MAASMKRQGTTFESIRQRGAEGQEFWLARDLAPLLEYQDWRNFMQVVNKARTACEQSGKRAEDHFGDATKMVAIGSGARRQVEDVRLSRYACYLIVQNGDPSKPVIANGQTYFALQTRRHDLRPFHSAPAPGQRFRTWDPRSPIARPLNRLRCRRRNCLSGRLMPRCCAQARTSNGLSSENFGSVVGHATAG